MATTPAASLETLMKGVTSWDLPKSRVPSELLLTGEAAFPVMVNGKGQVLIAASSYGRGRLVVVAQEGYLISPFLPNAVGWLRPGPAAPVAVHSCLESLVTILRDSGVEAQVQPEPGEPLGVYCVDAYSDIPPEKLVQFVKGGGGLLIAGQAWQWASENGRDKVLSGFPGNQVTGVAGVYFTDITGDTDQFEVSKTMPNMPLYSRCKEELSEDRKQLLAGISELNTADTPSQLLVHGELAFRLGTDSSFDCFLAAARYGRGRVVLGGHESVLLNEKMAPFVVNAVHWLAGKQMGKIGLDLKMTGLGPVLSKHNLEWVRAQLPTSDLRVFCCSSFTKMEAEKVKEFVAEGGGLLVGMQAWLWGRSHPWSNCMSLFADNKILASFGLGVLDQTGKRGCFPVPNPEDPSYHIRIALAQLESMLYENGSSLEKSWLEKLFKDCAYLFRIPHKDIPIYESVKNHIQKMITWKGLPPVNKKNPVNKGSYQALLIALAHDLVKLGIDSSALLQNPSSLPPTTSPITIEITKDNRDSRVSTGLYLPEGQVAEVTLPDEAVAAKLKILIGCHTDNISHAKTYYRPPVVVQRYELDAAKKSISWLYGGLLYIIVPANYKVDSVSLTISGAVSAPYFRLGKTSKEEWQSYLQGDQAPWGELATDNIILTVPTSSLKSLEDPEPVLRRWDEIMQAIAKLAAQPFPWRRPERIVADVQISAGWMHSGYPVMCHLEAAQDLISEERMRRGGLWGPAHELGHNQQRSAWEFPAHTTEATCNLWSVYVHETILGIPRDQSHPALSSRERERRIRVHLQKGAPLSNWAGWTALETYLQLQEAFGWEPFTQLFADYQTISGLPKDKAGKMNLWVKKFSEKVEKNLVPFFEAWGWPIDKEMAKGLAHLPTWEDHPLRAYMGSDQ